MTNKNPREHTRHAPKRSNHAGPKRTTRGKPPRRVKSLQKFLKAYGYGPEGARLRHQFASRIDTSLPYLVALAFGYRIASAGMAVKIEVATHGLVAREDLRPGEDWAALAPRGEPQRATA